MRARQNYASKRKYQKKTKKKNTTTTTTISATTNACALRDAQNYAIVFYIYLTAFFWSSNWISINLFFFIFYFYDIWSLNAWIICCNLCFRFNNAVNMFNAMLLFYNVYLVFNCYFCWIAFYLIWFPFIFSFLFVSYFPAHLLKKRIVVIN